MQFFYDGQIRRYITQIIRLMSNFSYKDGDGGLKTIPVMYGDISRQVSHIIRDNSENKLPSVPRMGVYVTGLEMDRTRLADSSFISKVHVRERAYDSAGKEYINEQGKNVTVERLMPTPYTLTLNADIWTSNTEQKLQVMEQIMKRIIGTQARTTGNGSIIGRSVFVFNRVIQGVIFIIINPMIMVILE